MSFTGQLISPGTAAVTSTTMAPWLVLALLGITVHAAPVLNGTDILPVLYPAKEVEGEPILLHSDFEPSPTTTTNENYEVFIGPTSESSPLPDTILPTPENEIIDSQPIADPSDGKWWCGNNTFSRGLAHAIAKHDENMARKFTNLSAVKNYVIF